MYVLLQASEYVPTCTYLPTYLPTICINNTSSVRLRVLLLHIVLVLRMCYLYEYITHRQLSLISITRTCYVLRNSMSNQHTRLYFVITVLAVFLPYIVTFGRRGVDLLVYE